MSRDEDLTRPIIGIENRSAQEVFDIMSDRVTRRLARLAPAPEQVGVREAYSGVDDELGRAFIDGWNARLDHTDFDMAFHHWMLSAVTTSPADIALAALAQPEAARVGDTPQSASGDGQGGLREALSMTANALHNAATELHHRGANNADDYSKIATDAFGRLKEAVRSVLPSGAGRDDLPDDKVLPVYLSMKELRNLRALATAPASSVGNGRLRSVLIQVGRAVGCILADDVSTDFLMLVPAEVEAKLAALRTPGGERGNV